MKITGTSIKLPGSEAFGERRVYYPYRTLAFCTPSQIVPLTPKKKSAICRMLIASVKERSMASGIRSLTSAAKDKVTFSGELTNAVHCASRPQSASCSNPLEKKSAYFQDYSCMPVPSIQLSYTHLLLLFQRREFLTALCL